MSIATTGRAKHPSIGATIRVRNAVSIPQDTIMPGTQDRADIPTHRMVADAVTPTSGMLASIHLDYRIPSSAGEICKIGTYRKLAQKFVPVQAASARSIPKRFLGIVLDLMQLSGPGHFRCISSAHRAALHLPAGIVSP